MKNISSTHLDIDSLIKAVHLIQQLEQNPLDLSVSWNPNIKLNMNLLVNTCLLNPFLFNWCLSTDCMQQHNIFGNQLQTSCLSIESFGGNGINLVNENDGRRILFGESEDVPHHPWSFSEVLLHKLWTNHPDEGS